MAVCRMLLPNNPYRLHQHYKGTSVGNSLAVNIDILWISPMFKHYFCLKYIRAVLHWKPFWPTISALFI